MEAYKPAIWIYNANLRREKKLLNPLGYEKQHLISQTYLQMFYKQLLLMLVLSDSTLDPNLATFSLVLIHVLECWMTRHSIQSKMKEA
jgi:hypothetical protein